MTKKIIHPKTIQNIFFSQLCHFTKYLSYVIDIWSKKYFWWWLYCCTHVCSCVSSWIFWALKNTIKSLFLFLTLNVAAASLQNVFLFLSQKIDNNNVAMMSHRWCKLMKNRNFNCSIRFVPSNTNHHQSYHKTIHCQPKLSLVTAKFQCLRNKIVMFNVVKSHPPTFVFKQAKK